MKKIITLIVAMIISAGMQGQESSENHYYLKGLQYGFNFGAYIPNNSTANYYNGSGKNSLQKAIIDSGFWNGGYNPTHKEIREKAFGGYDFRIKELPMQMRYNVAVNIGFFGKYNFEDNFGIYLEINYAKLKAKDAVQLEILGQPSISYEKYKFYNLMGYESRVDINFGIAKSFGPPRIFKPFVEAAVNMNNTRVVTSDIIIDHDLYDKRIDLKYSYLNQYNEYYNLRDDGVGYGALIGGGVQVIFSQSLVLHAGVDFSMKQIHLGDYKGYKLNTIAYFRLLFHNIISTKPEA